MDLVCLY